MDNSVIAKSGWLYLQTSVSKKWKKSWVELYRDGHLKHYENECSPNAEDTILVPSECLTVKAGLQVETVQPPEKYGIHNLLSVITSTGKTWVFCGESLDDMRAWQLAIEQSRLLAIHPHLSLEQSYLSLYNPNLTLPYLSESSAPYWRQLTYPPSFYGYLGPQYVSSNPATSALFYQPNRYYYPEGTDTSINMLGASSMGSLMWGPALWW